jgi:hypothetical protein
MTARTLWASLALVDLALVEKFMRTDSSRVCEFVKFGWVVWVRVAATSSSVRGVDERLRGGMWKERLFAPECGRPRAAYSDSTIGRVSSIIVERDLRGAAQGV